MMKNIKNIVLATSLCSSLLLGGCEKFLDKRDPTATSFVEFFNTEEDLRRVVYSSYRDVFTHQSDRRLLFYMLDGRSDNGFARIETDHHMLMANGTMNGTSRLGEYYWTLFNKHLGRLNTFIANVEVPYVEDEAVRQRYKAILEALRVWHYFRLTFHWGNVPFVLEPVDLEGAVQPPKPKEEILETLFGMYEDIANRLPENEGTTNAYMFNRYSFKAMVMRYALYNGRYELAAKIAKEIMDSGKYQLHPVYGDMFGYKADKTNKEFIVKFDMESHDNSATLSFEHLGPHYRTGKGQSYMVPTKALVDAYWTLQGRPIDNCPLHTKAEYELDPHLNRDPRYKASIFGHGDTFQGEKINIYDANNPMYHENVRASRSGFWFKKFVDEADAFRSGGNMHFPLLRYAEVLLTYAEAKIMLGQVDDLAKKCINDVRRRAGLDMTVADVSLGTRSQQEWIKLIQNERRTEFAGEGIRYDDIIRWRIAEDVLNQPALGHTRLVDGKMVSLKIEDRRFQSHQYLWPFHESTLKVEPNIVQNQGY
ncbi:RagB/SusD family nutrient uptake outer membrane protein [Sphingobacterium suaedae]|uniref:RagB/SusD family nutrient uptake outer membrane protein n=1 Tax=Sphingobacterium suaedae TaxID=1686402 RepID=A0ABW5KMS3_9SPHI